MLGNDVVDLRDADARPESFRPRFDARVFLPEERVAIARDPDPLARRWAHWAAKEAAFKLARQVDPGFFFAPGRLSVRFDRHLRGTGQRVERRGHVEWTGPPPQAPWRGIEVRSFETEERIHVIALPVGADWGAVDFKVESLEGTASDPSLAVRRLAVREIARSLGVAPDRLSIGRAIGRAWTPAAGASSADARRKDMERLGRLDRQRRVPTVELDGGATSLALSLSHHGRWLAYAMTPRPEAAIAVDHSSFQPGSGLVRAGMTRR